MHCDRKRIIAASVFLLSLLCTTFYVGEAQENQTRLAYADGIGSLRVGDEKFKLSAAVVKLLPDHKAEITLVSDITVFVSATWSNHADSQNEFDLKITGGASAGGLDGTGKVSLSQDNKSLQRLTLKGVSKTTKRAVEADFEGK